MGSIRPTGPAAPGMPLPPAPPACGDLAGPGTVDGIDIDWLFEGPLVRLNRWRCREVTTGLTTERQQHWRVVGFVHSGAYELRSPRGTALIDPVRVAFLNPEEPYRTSHPCGCGDHGSSLIVREDVVMEVVAERRPDLAESTSGPFQESSGPCTSEASLRQRTLLRRIREDPAIDPLSIEEAALATLAEVVRAAFPPRWRVPRAISTRARRSLAEQARHVLGREFRRPVGLEELSSGLGTTPFHLCRVFREWTGYPVHRYLTLLRLHAAMESLEAGEKDLSRLALDLGYSSHSHFTFVFRREFGFPPSRFRRTASRRPRARIR